MLREMAKLCLFLDRYGRPFLDNFDIKNHLLREIGKVVKCSYLVNRHENWTNTFLWSATFRQLKKTASTLQKKNIQNMPDERNSG